MLFNILAIFMLFQPINSINTELIDPSLASYYKNFYYLAESHKIPSKNFQKLKNIQIKIIKEEKETAFLDFFFHSALFNQDIVALCIPENNIILIRESKIQGRTDYSMQELINHELGHCVLGRKHLDQMMPFEDTWTNSSTMISHIINNYNNENIKKYLEEELFDSTKFNQLEPSLDPTQETNLPAIKTQENFIKNIII